MFSFEDFNKEPEFYTNINPDPNDLADFTSSLMIVTHMLKNIDHKDGIRGGHEVMMKLFNMTGLTGTKEEEGALNVIMCLLSHVVAMLTVNEERDKYFEYFDNVVIYPLLKESEN